jgi:hypothetical protein
MARSRFRENGGCVAPFAGRSWDVQRAAEKPLLHPWSENHNLTRRVLAITDHSDSEVKILGLFPVAKRKRHSMLRAPLSNPVVVLSPRAVTIHPIAQAREVCAFAVSRLLVGTMAHLLGVSRAPRTRLGVSLSGTGKHTSRLGGKLPAQLPGSRS